MSRKQAESAVARALGSIASRDRRLIGAVLASLLSLVAPLSASARQQTEPPSMTVIIDVSTGDCSTVRVGYDIEWHGFSAESGLDPSTISLFAQPNSFFLTSVDFGKKADKSHGKVKGELIRESGYFDHQTYPGLAYQLVVSSSDDSVIQASAVTAIPDCEPMSPTSGPSAGGTVVTIVGGSTFGGSPFGSTTMVDLVLPDASVVQISPSEVAPDGTWLRFITPPGDPGTCVSTFTEPGLPFPLPSFCYGP